MNSQPNPTALAPSSSALLTDLYALTMMDAYHQLGMQERAVFELYVRRLPDSRNFLVAAGLEQVLEYLENLRFSDADLEWLRGSGLFRPRFIEELAAFRFTGDVMAMCEGSVFFASEPILRVTAPLPQAQLIESRVLNLLQYQTLVASKAARCRLVAGDAKLIDFGMRRAHGAEAALFASRACYIAGFDATATVEAGRRFGIPLVGTMAHSFIQAHDLEQEAFRRFARARSRDLVLLIDTYDTDRAAARVTELAAELANEGIEISGVRIDSGDLLDAARRVRHILDAAGCTAIKILASGNIDEQEIAALRASGAPIDVYCVGTKLSTSSDAPLLDCVYKLQQYADRPCRKRSVGKETWPGPRQVFRQYDAHHQIAMDVLACADEVVEGKALLHEVMVGGRRLAPAATLDSLRKRVHSELATLPPALCSLEKSLRSPVKVSAGQRSLAEVVDQLEH